MSKEIEKVIMDDVKACAINVALEMEMAFKLYSYRVIGHEQFLMRVQDLCKYFIETAEKAENDEKPESETD